MTEKDTSNTADTDLHPPRKKVGFKSSGQARLVQFKTIKAATRIVTDVVMVREKSKDMKINGSPFIQA